MKIFFIFLIIFSNGIFAAAQMHIDLNAAVIKQGSLVDAVIRLDSNSVQQVELQKLKGVSLGETLYLYQVSPLLRSGDSFEADAKIIFLKVPEGKYLIHKLGENEVSISWSDVEVLPTEAPVQFLFGKFEIPGKKRVVEISILLLIFSFMIFGGLKLKRRLKKKKELRKIRSGLKDKVMSASEYQEVVSLWQQKVLLTKEFPHLSDHFKELETVLFKYQFKQSQNEIEKMEVMKAYRDFVNKVQGGFNGI